MKGSVELIDLAVLGDERGSLVAIEGNKNLPFDIKRIYYIFNTKNNVARGFHAHKNLKQVAICISGSCTFLVDDGNSREAYALRSPKKGLLIEGLVWREMFDFSEDCVLLLLASEYYDEYDYIHDYDEFQIESQKL